LRNGDATNQHLRHLLSGDLAGKVRIGVFIAHGAEDGLLERNPAANPHGGGTPLTFLLDEDTCTHFDNAILLLLACLRRGTFPPRIVPPQGRVRAVIGYLDVFGWHWMNDHPIHPLTAYHTSLITEALRKGIVLPLETLANGNSIDDAVVATRKHWEEMADCTSFPDDLRYLFGLNALNIRAWPLS
jgi:hypothetical protein